MIRIWALKTFRKILTNYLCIIIQKEICKNSYKYNNKDNCASKHRTLIFPKLMHYL